MKREEKTVLIDELKQKFAKAQLAILSDFKGLKVNDFNNLRRQLRQNNAEVKVVKNRLAKLALKGSPFESISDLFKGTVALTLTDTDPVAPAKILVQFAKDNEVVKFKAASMQGKTMTAADLEALSKLPSREELVAKLMGSMQAPMRNLVSVMAQLPRQIVQVLAAVRDQKEKS